MHKSYLYENQRELPDVNPGVLAALYSIGSTYTLQSAALQAWDQLPTARNNQLSNSVAQRVGLSGGQARFRPWLREIALLGRGEEANGLWNEPKASVIAKQIIGWALIMNQEAIANSVLEQILPPLQSPQSSDYVTLLSKATKGAERIEFSSDGPDHSRTFYAELSIPGLTPIVAAGPSKKVARLEACKLAMRKFYPAALAEAERRAPAPRGKPIWMSGTPREHQACARRLAEELEVADAELPLIQQALIHRSWTYENKLQTERANQDDWGRLAFVGSHVIDFSVAVSEGRDAVVHRIEDYVFHTVSDGHLAQSGRHLDLLPGILTGRGANTDMQASSAAGQAIIADVLQATVAAARIATGHVILPRTSPERWALVSAGLLTPSSRGLDAITTMQRYCSATGVEASFEESRRGPDHGAQYRAQVTLTSSLLARVTTVLGEWESTKTGARKSASRPVVAAFRSVSEQTDVQGLSQAQLSLASFIASHMALAATALRPPDLARLRLFGAHLAQDRESWIAWARVVDSLLPDSVSNTLDQEALSMLLAAFAPPETDALVQAARRTLQEVRDVNEAPALTPSVLAMLAHTSGVQAALLRARSSNEAVSLLETLEGALLLSRFSNAQSVSWPSTWGSVQIGAVEGEAMSAVVRAVLRACPDCSIDGQQDSAGQVRVTLHRIERAVANSVASRTVDVARDAVPSLGICYAEGSLILRVSPARSVVGRSPVSWAVEQVSSRVGPWDWYLANSLHDIKNKLSAAVAASQHNASGRTEKLNQQAAVSGFVDDASGIALWAIAETQLAAAHLQGESDLTTQLRAFASRQLEVLPQGVSLALHEPTQRLVGAIAPEALHLVLDNLAKNAVEALEGAGRLEVSWVEGDDADAWIELLSVGARFADSVLEAFASPGAAVKSEKLGGSGIGLRAVQSVIRRVAGTVSIWNANSGSAVLLTLPLVLGEANHD